MHPKRLLLAAFAATAVAQQNLISTLMGQPTLSNLTSLLGSSGIAVNTLNSLRNVTLLAPNNDAIMAFMNSSAAAMVASDSNLLSAVLEYHILNGTYPMINMTSFVHSSLMPGMYANVTGGQAVEAMAMDGNVTFFSGLMSNSSVVSSMALNFTGGVIHIIDRVLMLPQNISSTAVAFNLTAAAGALTQAKLVTPFDTMKDLTVFVPNNDAFQAIGSALPNLTMAQVKSILTYHCIEGSVLYSTSLMNDTMYKTTEGTNITVRMMNNMTYVNNARVVLPDVLVANGVVHVIDEVLNPMNSTAMPNSSMDMPGFGGASSATDVPYTSGVPTPTSMIATPTGAGSSSSSGGAWMPAATGAMGAAALFGGAAVMMNM